MLKKRWSNAICVIVHSFLKVNFSKTPSPLSFHPGFIFGMAFGRVNKMGNRSWRMIWALKTIHSVPEPLQSSWTCPKGRNSQQFPAGIPCCNPKQFSASSIWKSLKQSQQNSTIGIISLEQEKELEEAESWFWLIKSSNFTLQPAWHNLGIPKEFCVHRSDKSRGWCPKFWGFPPKIPSWSSSLRAGRRGVLRSQNQQHWLQIC